VTRFDPFNLTGVCVYDSNDIPTLPQGIIERLSAVMTLWHDDPWKASWFIDPKLAEKLWGKSRSGKDAAPAIGDKVEAEIRELWLRDPERAVFFVKPTQAIKRYGRPAGMNARRLVELHKIYLKVHGAPEPGGMTVQTNTVSTGLS